MAATSSAPRVIAQRDLRNDSGAILRRAQQGETFLVTVRGEKVAILSPIGGSAVPQERRTPARPARRHGGWALLPLVTRETSIQEEIDYLRGER